MISAASRPYIDASVPVLREHGLAITTLFYKNMLGEHPELTRLFNMGNQARGAQQQSLASAVFAYAANIGTPEALGPVVKRISVRREDEQDTTPAGEVSNWLHANVQAGSVLQVTHPFGEFTPDTESDKTIVLLSAGVGITPMVSALNRIALVNPQRQVIFAHAARDARHHALRDDVAAAQAVMPNLHVATFYEEVNGEAGVLAGRMDLARLPAWEREAAEVWICGPLKFMQAQWLALLDAGVPPARLHREVFGPELLDHLL